MNATTTTTPTTTETDPRWAAVVARDSNADGRFFYSVASTGVYCRPSCASRTARPKNVRFHATRAAAEAAGFRPCKRCRPDQPPRAEQHAAAIAAACRLIETSECTPPLATLASTASLSRYHFHRLFKAATGLTPKGYAGAWRARRLRETLPRSTTVTEAAFDAGYNSGARFYAQSDALLGMTPSNYRNGGEGVHIRFALGECSLGTILVAQSVRGVCAISLGDDGAALVRELHLRFPRANLLPDDGSFAQLVAAVASLAELPGTRINLPLDIRGTAFQQRVWNALREIPAGATLTYAQLAENIGAPRAVRAVASACAANVLALAIPCHRVLRSDGKLSGYRWGVERKRTLLAREAGGTPSSEKDEQR